MALRTTSLFYSSTNNELDKQDQEGNTLLHLAVKASRDGSRFDHCEELLKNWADPNIPDHEGTKPLQSAIENGDQPIIDLLEDYGATL